MKFKYYYFQKNLFLCGLMFSIFEIGNAGCDSVSISDHKSNEYVDGNGDRPLEYLKQMLLVERRKCGENSYLLGCFLNLLLMLSKL